MRTSSLFLVEYPLDKTENPINCICPSTRWYIRFSSQSSMHEYLIFTSVHLPCPDSIGLHRVENVSHTERACSLHLYSPPFQHCQTFDQRTGHKNTVKLTFWSKYGEKTLHVSTAFCHFRGSSSDVLRRFRSSGSPDLLKVPTLHQGFMWNWTLQSRRGFRALLTYCSNQNVGRLLYNECAERKNDYIEFW